jgi:hypothetical protein
MQNNANAALTVGAQVSGMISVMFGKTMANHSDQHRQERIMDQ